MWLEQEINKTIQQFLNWKVYQKICENVWMDLIFSTNSSKKLTPELREDFSIDDGNEGLISQLLQEVQQYKIEAQQNENYAHQLKKMKKENLKLSEMITKLRMASEREINAREIENNNLKKRIENILKTQNRKRASKKQVVIDYIRITKDIEIDENNVNLLDYDQLHAKLIKIYGHQNVMVNENLILEINCDRDTGQQVMSSLIQREEGKICQVYKLPSIKRLRIENVFSMHKDIKVFLKFWLPENLQIFVFNVNGVLLDMSLFIDILCEKVFTKVYNLYLYYLNFKENDLKRMCEAIKVNKNFQDLRVYASKFNIGLFSAYLEENESIWLISLSFDNLKSSDADFIIKILEKCKNVKEFWAHHNSLGEEGTSKIASFVSENLIDQIDYLDLSDNQAPLETYKSILVEKGFEGVLK